VKTVSCPTCQRPVAWSPASPYRPFCSERCKLVDLGEWFEERRAIPGEEMPVVGGAGDEEPEPRH
jgi:hypothetical protein